VGCNVCSVLFRESYIDVVDGCEGGGSGGRLWRSTQMKNDDEKGKFFEKQKEKH